MPSAGYAPSPPSWVPPLMCTEYLDFCGKTGIAGNWQRKYPRKFAPEIVPLMAGGIELSTAWSGAHFVKQCNDGRKEYRYSNDGEGRDGAVAVTFLLMNIYIEGVRWGCSWKQWPRGGGDYWLVTAITDAKISCSRAAGPPCTTIKPFWFNYVHLDSVQNRRVFLLPVGQMPLCKVMNGKNPFI